MRGSSGCQIRARVARNPAATHTERAWQRVAQEHSGPSPTSDTGWLGVNQCFQDSQLFSGQPVRSPPCSIWRGTHR